MSKKYINGVPVKNNINGLKIVKANKHFATEYEGFTIHNNGNVRSSGDEDINWASKQSTKEEKGYHPSWHYSVDRDGVIRFIPWGYSCYAAGDGVRGFGNAKTINIEINEYNGFANPSDENWLKARKNATKLIAQISFDKGWGIDKVKQHWHRSKKNCPRVLRKDIVLWGTFLEDIDIEIDRLKGVEKEVKEDTKQQLIKENIAKVNKEETRSLTKDVNINLGSEKYNKLLDIVSTIKDNKYKSIGTIIVLIYIIFDIVKELI